MGVIDGIIVASYLLFIFLYGYFSGKKLKNLHDFSVSTSKRSTFILFASMSASFIGGGFSAGNATEVYKTGIGNILILCGFAVCQIITGMIIVPKMRIRKSDSSPGMMMERAYGKPARVATGLFNTLMGAGLMGAQIAAIGTIFNLLLGIPYVWGAILGFGIVLSYSTSGGIESVVKIDVIQFIMLVLGMGVLFVFCFSNYKLDSLPIEYLNPLNGHSPIEFISMFITMLLGEALLPGYIQRVLMADSRHSVKKATVYSGMLSVPFFVVTGMIGLYAYVQYKGISPDAVLPYMVLNSLPPIIRGFVIAATLSIAMSAADSTLNGAAIGCVNDLIIPLNGGRIKNELLCARVANIIIGVFGVLSAFLLPDVMGILVFSYTFWTPTVLVPLCGALLGKKLSTPKFMVCIGVGCISSIIWNYLLLTPFEINGAIVGFVANLILYLYFIKKRKA